MVKKENQQQQKIDTQNLPFSTPIGYILFITKPHKKWAILAILAVIVAAVFEQSMSYIFKLIIDSVETGNQSRALYFGLAFPAALFIMQSSFRVSGVLAMRWANNVRKDGYEYFFRHVLKHSHGYFSDRFAGSIHNKIRNVVEGVDSLIPEILWTYINSIVTFLVTLVFIVMINKTVATIFVLLAVVLYFANKVLAPLKQKYAFENAEASSRMHAGMIDVFSNVSATRQYSRGVQEEKHIGALTYDHFKTGMASWGRTEFMLFINGTIIFLFGSVMFFVLVERWKVGAVTTGEFVLVTALISQVSSSLIFIGRAFNSTARTMGEMKEGFSELLVPFEINDIPEAKKLERTGGEIIWKDVTFDYGENRVFDTFNLSIPQGQRVGLVGSSGAGKTTFVSLLLRQHDLHGGSITIDGENIAEVTQDSLREHIAVVPQEPMLFHRSIRENIAYGKPDATDKEIIAVAKKAQAHDFVTTLPLKYDTMVGERGVKLSGGQKQRVAIARAMLKDAPILVLDEATSALDSESEVAIQKALHELMEGKTVVAIAHRLSTLREMDRILVLENGKIVEDGTHTELTKAGGTYARLWEHQAGGFLVE